ncbi:MAG: bifunctional diguanylate cyclase/phosphodiesterase [Caldilineaceae bacterium]
MLAPISLTFLSLRRYLEAQVKPQLPIHFTDEAGMLMADTMYTIDKLDETIQQLQHYDTLTALPNRVLFHTELKKKLERWHTHAPIDRRGFALMLLDIDNFANFNNNLGQQEGDLLLRQAAQRLTSYENDGRLIARVGGDEFAILHEGYTCISEVITQAKRHLALFSKPFVMPTGEYHLSISIGIATVTSAVEDANTLLANADMALRVAKQQGRNAAQFYSTEMNQALQQRLELERDMRKALDRGEFQLYYQPQLDLANGRIIGAEALLRWQHPTKGFVAPSDIIPIAEESGMILPLGEWVLREACRQNHAWHAAGLPSIRMAVNLSAAQFQQADLIELVSTILAETKLDPGYLELEITESLLMEDVEQAIVILHQLHALGVTVALDDFGTGYSSLNYLKRFPLHYLKIDRSFVNGVPDDCNDAAIVRAIVALAKSLQLSVIAEGVENAAQASYLHQIGCFMFQGYYYSRPIPAANFVHLWRENLQQGAPTWFDSVRSSQRSLSNWKQLQRPATIM